MRRSTLWALRALAVFCGVVLAGRSVAADQCTRLSLTQEQLDRALASIAAAPSVLAFCEPCKDKAPRAISKSAAAAGLRDTREDAAYLYVQTSEDLYTNVATIVSCPTVQVSPRIDRKGQPR